MIEEQFKIQPVAAFYGLLAKSFLYITVLSVLLGGMNFILIGIGFNGVLDTVGLKELQELVSTQPADPDGLARQSGAIRDFLMHHPETVMVFFISFILTLFSSAYLFKSTQHFIKNKLFDVNHTMIKTLVPDAALLKILIYLALISGILVFTGGFVAVSIAGSPFLGYTALILMLAFLVRTGLFIPGVVIGDMEFMEALKYSLQTISLGRSFKILIFGTLIFLVLSFVISLLMYFPAILFKAGGGKIFLSIFMAFVQLGFISVGTASLFIRYGNFEEVKMAE